MLIKIFPDLPAEEQIRKVAYVIANGGVVIIPTDSVYGIACSIRKPKAVERVARLKKMKLKNADFSFMFNDLSMVSEYAKPLSNQTFKLIKKNTPGAFTFIVEANNKVSKIFKNNKKTLGVRIPDNSIVRALVKELGHPLLTSSVIDEDDITEYTTDPSLIYERFGNQVDMVIDGGYGNNEASTLVDCTGNKIEIIREGVQELIF